jgi:hypothetical protein
MISRPQILGWAEEKFYPQTTTFRLENVHGETAPQSFFVHIPWTY